MGAKNIGDDTSSGYSSTKNQIITWFLADSCDRIFFKVVNVD